MPARLKVIAGPNPGQVYPVPESGIIVIGRGDTATVRLTDPSVSRTHCAIEWAAGKPVLKDAGSRTGTKVNGKAILEHPLQSNEVILVGSTQLRFQAEAPSPPPPVSRLPKLDTAPDELRVLSGTVLAQFAVGEVLAVGRSGVVFRAHDTKEDRAVALKVYVPEFARSEEDLQRFIRAVKTMLPMRHSNLITLYGGGKSGPYCWMAMELVEGETLTEMIKRIGTGGKMDWRPALRLALHVSRGLNYIHGEQIVHRNLTPDNILLSKVGGAAKLGSLILAKALAGALAQDVTVGTNPLGDVRYLSPEQVGSGDAVDARADLYSLGAVVYALLTGRAPFEGASVQETALWILKREPVPPQQVDPTIPDDLQRIVLRTLAKKPADRYASAADLLAALEALPRV